MRFDLSAVKSSFDNVSDVYAGILLLVGLPTWLNCTRIPWQFEFPELKDHVNKKADSGHP